MIKSLTAALSFVIVSQCIAVNIPYDAEVLNVQYITKFYKDDERLKTIYSNTLLINGAVKSKSGRSHIINYPFVAVDCVRGSHYKVDPKPLNVGSTVYLSPSEDFGFGVFEFKIDSVKDDYAYELSKKEMTVNTCSTIAPPTAIQYTKRVRVKVQDTPETVVELNDGYSVKYMIQVEKS